MKRTAVFLIICMLMILPAAAAEAPAGLSSVQAPCALLMAGDGTVIFEKNAHEKREPASVTKIMTMLLVMEALREGSISLEDVVTASDYACSLGGSQIWMRQGEQFTVRELLKCVAVASANDCATLLGEHIAGTEEGFVALMNKRAAELGMKNTHFANCCGLPADGHLTTAYDIALMTCELLKHEEIFEYTTIWMDTIRGGTFRLTNTNKLLRSYDGINGMKTGYTSSAGYCISATAKREELQLIAVVMAESGIDARTKDVTAMLNYGFANYTMVQITPEQPIMTVPVKRGRADRVLCTAQVPGPILTEKSRAGLLTQSLQLKEELIAPVRAGDRAGELTIYCEDAEILRIPVVAAEDVEALALSDCFIRVFSRLTGQK